MIKLVFCVRRLETLSESEFLDHWLNRHGPMVRDRSQALGMRRYVQTHPLHTRASEVLAQVRNAPSPYDGVTECWWDSLADMHAAGATAEGRRAALELLEDERGFIDLEHSPLWLSEEQVIF